MARVKKGTADTSSTKRPRGKPPKPKPESKELTPVRHGLYIQPGKVKVDGRSFFARRRKKLRGAFLADFQAPPSSRVQAIADGAAVNWICIEGFRSAFLRGEVISPSAWKDYIALSNSLARDLMNLEELAKEGSGKDKAPNLEEYLKIKEKADRATVIPAVVKVTPQEDGPDLKKVEGAAGPAPPEEKPKGSPLF